MRRLLATLLASATLSGAWRADAAECLVVADFAKATVGEILRTFGWSVVDIGGIEGSRYLEPLAMIWILQFFRTNNGNHAFKLLRK